MLNPHHVATFLVLIRKGSFCLAAEELGLSQPAVSHQIRRLEQTLGTRLIERKGCTLTTAGLQFVSRAEALVRVNQRALRPLGNSVLRIGAASNIGIYILQPMIRKYREVSPDAPAVDLTIGPNQHVVDRLLDAEIDLAITEWWTSKHECQAFVWRHEELVVIVPPEHAWVSRRQIEPGELAQARLLGGEPGTGTGRLLREYFDGLGKMPNMDTQLGSTEAVKQAVANGLGISLVLKSFVQTELATGKLCAIPLKWPGIRKPLWAVWCKQLQNYSGREDFVRLLSEAACYSTEQFCGRFTGTRGTQ